MKEQTPKIEHYHSFLLDSRLFHSSDLQCINVKENQV